MRVTPPPGFVDDLDLIGAKLDFVNHMEQKHNPEIFNLKNPPTIQSSINQQEQVIIVSYQRKFSNVNNLVLCM